MSPGSSTPDAVAGRHRELGLTDAEFALIVDKLGREPKNGWVARRGASGQTLSLWFVARDDRGGVSWTTRQVQVK